MVYFEKSQPAPEFLSNKYNIPEVVQRLQEDFHNKCYICEQKAPTDINIEHFKSKDNYEDLKTNWDNLFFACAHCNHVKSSKYDNLLNCTIESDEVETALSYHCNPFPKEKARIEVVVASEKACSTKELLEKCYNGEHTAQKEIESSNLRSALIKEIKEFQDLLFEYFENDKDEFFLIKIKQHLSNRSAFTAFKRWIIRDNEYLMSEFGHCFCND